MYKTLPDSLRGILSNTTTLKADGVAEVVLVKSGNDYTFQFGIPRGKDGTEDTTVSVLTWASTINLTADTKYQFLSISSDTATTINLPVLSNTAGSANSDYYEMMLCIYTEAAPTITFVNPNDGGSIYWNTMPEFEAGAVNAIIISCIQGNDYNIGAVKYTA